MIKNNIMKLFTLLAMFAIVLVSCEETEDPIDGSPNITSLSHIIAPAGTEITINGSGFGISTGRVLFTGTAATTIASWTDGSIRVVVPPSAPTSGDIQVEDAEGTLSQKISFYVGPVAPAPPTLLEATALSSSSIKIRWTASASQNLSIFKDYSLIVTGAGSGPRAPVSVAKTATDFTVSDLVEGDVYTFELVAQYSNDAKSSVATVTWSPASRFSELSTSGEPIRVFESASSKGSGLVLYDASSEGSTVMNVANSPVWNLALDTRNNVLLFGSARAIDYNYAAGQPTATEISDIYYDAESLNEVFDSQALNSEAVFGSLALNLNQLGIDNNLVVVARVKQGSNADYNYAKILVKRVNGNYLQGTAPDRYIECEISYQKAPGVPYAGVNKGGRISGN